MRIFALETDIEKLKKRYITPAEKEIFTTHRHGLYFIKTIFVDVLFTILLGVMAYLSYVNNVMAAFDVVLIALGVWSFIAFFSLLRVFLDWKYDFIALTNEKLLIVNQSSVFKQEVNPLNLHNIQSVSAETQWLNLFGFGAVRIVIKEAAQTDVLLTFIPRAEDIVAKISQQITFDDNGNPS
ncbi:MAG: hypothetical protein KBD00_01855 [Candidatus Peribacteraceae bacterium]|nr:hypothetical protein [Candidatus Peribacteraceae bacterium]